MDAILMDRWVRRCVGVSIVIGAVSVLLLCVTPLVNVLAGG